MPARVQLKQRALATAGALAKHVPVAPAQLFAFVASPAVRAEPWDVYRRLHAGPPVRSTRWGVWLVGSHAAITDVLRDPATSVDEANADAFPDADHSGPFSELMRSTLLFTDPPDHARLRRLVARAFTPRTVEALRPRVEAMVDDTLAKLRPRGRGDLLGELARPLPVAVICELLGVPERERARFAGWAQDLAPRLDLDLFRDDGKNERGDRAAEGLASFFAELLRDPSRYEPDGLLAALVAVEEEGDRLDHDEVVALAVLLLVAGFETTMNLVGNGVLALIRNPAELARVRDGDVDPAVAVEELLRYAGPVQFTQRVLMRPATIGGQELPERALVALLIGAGNRDPRVFADPDRLDVGRAPNPHLAFSSGIHHCVGAALARLEAAIMIPAILRTLPDLRLASKPQWRPTFVLRGLRALDVAWR